MNTNFYPVCILIRHTSAESFSFIYLFSFREILYNYGDPGPRYKMKDSSYLPRTYILLRASESRENGVQVTAHVSIYAHGSKIETTERRATDLSNRNSEAHYLFMTRQFSVGRPLVQCSTILRNSKYSPILMLIWREPNEKRRRVFFLFFQRADILQVSGILSVRLYLFFPAITRRRRMRRMTVPMNGVSFLLTTRINVIILHNDKINSRTYEYLIYETTSTFMCNLLTFHYQFVL